jgi:ATP-binding cassette subfamily B protein
MRRYVCNSFFADVLFIGYLVYQAAVLHSISFSTVAILYGSFGRLKNSMRVFSETYPFACETSLYVNKIREFLNYEPKIVSKEKLVPSNKAKEIELDKVSFAYGKNTDMLLKDLNLHIKPGEKIALVGYNGAGKTTLVKLLMRLYDTKAGVIKADGQDIKEYDVKKYHDTIGTVFQDFQIFAGSVKENVLLDVADGIEDEGIKKALTQSGLMERINKFEKGLDTELTTEFSQEGVNLSGGESQKLAISRVFYKDAGLMILDEPSSALDPIAEYQLNHAMLEATGDKTVIFISHRLSTTRIADRIIMLENGKIVEQGTHEELLAMKGKYAQMWKVQAGAYITV